MTEEIPKPEELALPRDIVEEKPISYSRAKQLMKEARERERGGKYVMSEKQKANVERLVALNRERREKTKQEIEQEKKKADTKAEEIKQNTITVKVKPKKSIKKPEKQIMQDERQSRRQPPLDDGQSEESEEEEEPPKKKVEAIKKKMDIVSRIDSIINPRKSQYDMMAEVMKRHF